jgi:peptide/histidine transporter 3/4
MTRWEGYVDWRNKPALRGRHGGMLAASFVLGQFQISLFIILINTNHEQIKNYFSFLVLLFRHLIPSKHLSLFFF